MSSVAMVHKLPHGKIEKKIVLKEGALPTNSLREAFVFRRPKVNMLFGQIKCLICAVL